MFPSCAQLSQWAEGMQAFEALLKHIPLEACRYFICGFSDTMNGEYLSRLDDSMGFCEKSPALFFSLKGAGSQAQGLSVLGKWSATESQSAVVALSLAVSAQGLEGTAYNDQAAVRALLGRAAFLTGAHAIL